MGKKKAFINPSKSQRFRLVPDGREKSDRFVPDAEHIAEQQKYGVYYDDDYDYMQHMRGINEGMKLESVDEPVEKVTIRNPISAFPPAPPLFGMMAGGKKQEFVDNDVSEALEGNLDALNNGELEDDFITLAGGVVDERHSFYRPARNVADSDEDEEGEEEEGMFDDYNDEELFGEECEQNILRPERTEQRDIDHAFEHLMDNEYNSEQIGELDGDDYDVGGCIDPNDGRLHELANEKKSMGNEDYDEELAKHYVRERMRLIEAGVITDKEETEIVEVDETSRKRMKWDCESFATQYTNIYNHPTLIKEPGLSRKALKRFDKANEEMDIAEENEEEMEDDNCTMMDDDDDDDDDLVSTVSTYRPKGETPEQRKLRKAAVKEARRNRRQEKKANKMAFADESRKLAKGRIGQIKAKPL